MTKSADTFLQSPELPRGQPAPITDTANDRANRLDAESEAWMKERAAVYAVAVEELLRDADTWPAPWPEDAELRKHWPELWSLFHQYRQAQQRLLKHVGNARKRYS